MLFNSVATLPFFMSINTDGYSKEQIVENLMKENMDSFKYPNNNKLSDSLGMGLNIASDNDNKNNNNADISLKENKNGIKNNEDTQVFNKKRKCC